MTTEGGIGPNIRKGKIEPGFAFPGDSNSPLYNSNVSLCDVQPAYTTNPISGWGGFMTTLGLSPQSVTTAWGEPMRIGNGPNANSGANTCNGNNRDPSSGVLLSVPVIGTY
ncbi:hypothetical protein [Acidithiobacillus sp.]